MTLEMAVRPVMRRWVLLLLHLLEALPLFLVGTLLLLLLANPDALALFPAYGMGYNNPDTGVSLTQLAYLFLPVVCLVLAALPALVIPLDAALQQNWQQPYLVTARAKGLSVRQAWWRHAFPNALLPLLTRLTDMVPTLVGGAVVVELLFALPGAGRLLLDAAASRDYPVLLGGVLLTALVRLLAWLAADVLYAVVDPRLRTAA
ncbi:hypothetical protein GCM10023186_09920 [Hymenobacter koreensis]|uniref:ABC transmembrane type-1 domain-containing protein n=2 Tax=Hymenobacter koreensis TaxID=1084523 RepID=A0ABP8IWN8_9BACT